ncbi:MAG: hypothetical protein P8H03_01165 [Emcibacteraceae bacterium]|nr:hypothetical protein [Emcibacteraceae bacterium]MDG1996682.1 hypothetical protein [Emcibacteraceae bacterium]
MPDKVHGVQPHNVFLQFIVEWGFVGATFAIWGLWLAFYKGLRRNISSIAENSSISRLASGLIIVSLSTLGLVTGPFFHGQPLLYLSIAFAIWVSSRAYK